jgi:D-3-phosphoglycerate dehydrogenase
MKSTAILINTSRGPLVDEVSLYEALKEQRIGGAALDVVETPPGTGEQPLISLDNVILTPHMAGYAENYLDPFWEYSVTTVLDIAKGISPRSCVNPEVQSRASRLKT